jgi:hypothetical protein
VHWLVQTVQAVPPSSPPRASSQAVETEHADASTPRGQAQAKRSAQALLISLTAVAH